MVISTLDSPARTYLYRRFACSLTRTDSRLAEKHGLAQPLLQRTLTSYP